jgi:hypothetical protein
MTPNIFSIAFNYVRLGDEDMITALWHYVLAKVPGVGQAFADEVASKSGLVPSRFVGALDHPRGTREDRPDLLLQCNDWSILFEHKLEAPVGPRQLERYLELARRNDWRFAVMAKRPIAVPPEVLNAPEFVAPLSDSGPKHFLWQDLQPLLRTAQHPLADEFVEFMEERGIGAFSWAGFGNPFYTASGADALRVLYGAVKPVFEGPGVRFVKKATSLVYEVRRPFAPVHLINIGPLESVAQDAPSLRGPVMGLWCWIDRGSRPTERVLPRHSATLKSDPEVFRFDPAEPTLLSGPVAAADERWYFTPLSRILLSSPEACNRAFREFARVCVDDLKADLSNAGTRRA